MWSFSAFDFSDCTVWINIFKASKLMDPSEGIVNDDGPIKKYENRVKQCTLREYGGSVLFFNVAT